MKRFFTLALLAWATCNLNAQVLFEQDFENGMAPMTLVNNDGKTPATPVAAYTEAWNVSNPAFGNGTNVAISNSWYTPAAAADDWMITPAIAITDANTIISWEAKAQDPNYPDGYQVLLSTTGTDLADFTNSLFTIGNELTDWQARSASLGNFVGETVYIAFRNNSLDMFLLLVDNIKVGNVLDYDVSLNKFSPVRYHVVGDDVNIEAEIENEGGQLLTSLDFHWSDGVDTVSETINGLNLANGETTTLTHSTLFNVAQPKRYDLTVWVDNPNGNVDGASDNNQLGSTVAGVTYKPGKKLLAEEGTGTWCGWCPYGTDYMEYMTDVYPDQFVGIAVHNEDPMVVTAYDAGVGAFPGFGGYPNVILDRDFVIHPVEFEDYASSYFERVTPVTPPTIDATLDVATRVLTVTASSEMLSNMDNLDFRYNLVLTEDGVKGTSAGYAQTNYFSTQSQNVPDPLPGYGLDWQDEPNPVPASAMSYDHVARSISDGFAGGAGSIPASVSAGEIVSKEYTVNSFNTGWNPFNMHAVVMVLDNQTGQALNAESAEIEVVCPNDFGASFDVTVASAGLDNGAIDMTPPANNFGFGGYTFAWDNGATSADLENLAAGTYTVTISDKIGCTQTADVTVGVSAVEDIEALASFSLTPNPATSFALLNANFTQAVDAEVFILNEAGQTMQQVSFKRTAALQHRFDLSNFASGVYFVKMSVGSQVHSSSLLISK